MARCERCGGIIASPSMRRHRGSKRCRAQAFIREQLEAGGAKVNKQWGRFIASLGVEAREGPIRYRVSRYGYGPTHGYWVPPRYAEVAAKTSLPSAVRREVMHLMAKQSEHLNAIEAALKLDPTARAALILLRAINRPSKNET